MASVIKRDFRTFDALNFIERVKSSATGTVEHIIHIGLSKDSDWVNEDLPPTPTDTKTIETDFWNDIIGFQRIGSTDVSVVVPRINWENGIEFVKFSEDNNNAYNQRFYCINSLYQVFMVEEVYLADPLTITEPIFSTNAVIDTNDGYRWRFLYDLSVTDINSTIQDNWMPVNIGTNQSANQITYGDKLAEWSLGAKHVLLQSKITDSGIPLDISYRQVGLIMDVKRTDGSQLTATNALPVDVLPNSGYFLYLENRKAINREVGQSETVKIVLQF